MLLSLLRKLTLINWLITVQLLFSSKSRVCLSFSVIYLFDLGHTISTQRLLVVLCSRITSGSAHRSLCDDRNWTGGPTCRQELPLESLWRQSLSVWLLRSQYLQEDRWLISCFCSESIYISHLALCVSEHSRFWCIVSSDLVFWGHFCRECWARDRSFRFWPQACH